MNILLVDDEITVIQSFLPALKSTPNFQVRVATTGAKALEHAETFGIVDLLITDVAMSPMNGFALRDLLLERCPLAKTIFISGYDLEEYQAQVKGSMVLKKPFQPEQLLDAIQEAISAPEPELELPAEEEILPEPLIPAPIEPEEIVEEDPLVGTTLRGFQILSKLGQGHLGPVYHALQTAINRPVALKMLSPRLQANEGARIDFLLDVSAKANVQHPNFIAVYEAGKAEGPEEHCFYAREFVEGETLSDLRDRNEHLDQTTVVKIIRMAAMALAYMDQHKIHHKMVSASSIFLGADNWARLTNLATHGGALPEIQAEIVALAEILTPLLEGAKARTPSVNALLTKMAKPNAQGFLSWAALLQALEAIEGKLKGEAPAKISAHNAAAIKAIENAKVRKKRLFVLSVIGLFGVLPMAGYWAYSKLNQPAVEMDFNAQCKIPAGTFIYGKGEKINLGTFWIDKYEVTIGQYAKFIDWIKEHPSDVIRYEHENQPRGKSHTPPNWESIMDGAKWGMSAKAGAIGAVNLNSPQSSVDFWDAYAYANWKGRRLPSEQEWEKAARGTDGRMYPWGNQWDPTKCNAGGGTPNTHHIESTTTFSPVDAFPTDISPYGAIGMSGNVSEWTDSWDPVTTNPVVRGGNFVSTEHELNFRGEATHAGSRSESVGFRTCSSDR